MDIQELISQGEHQQQDFKYCISSVSKIAHSLSAFSNTDGGRLLVGVRDNGRIAGVCSEEEIYMIDAAAKSFCSPSVECEMQTMTAEGHNVLVVTIPPSSNRPIRAREEDGKYCAYIRINDENVIASPVHLALWEMEKEVGEASKRVFSDFELRCLRLIPSGGTTLNRFTRHTRLSRKDAVRLMADYIRYGLVSMHHSKQNWVFSILYV